MLSHIRSLIPKHNLYCEPFAGGAAVFFDKEPVAINVINDLNGELSNFYKVAVSHSKALENEIVQILHCRSQFDHACYIYQNPQFFTPVQRACAVWMLSKVSFAGRLGRVFGFERTKSRHPRKLQNAKLAFCDELVALLEKATIECDDAFRVIKRYDTLETFYFLDPPYIGTDMGHYTKMFSEQNLTDLLEDCKSLQGKFMLTSYPNEMIRSVAEAMGWVIHKIKHQLAASKSRRKQEEWIICNY